jgi:hypothetical protein
MSTVKKLMTSTIKLLGLIGPGQNAPAYMLADALEAMNMMLESWSSAPQSIYVVTRDELTMSSLQTSYTIGTGGDFNVTRPQKIFPSFLTIDETDYPLKTISRDQYDRITIKSEPGIPGKIYYEPTFPLGTLYFYSAPREAYDFTLISMKPFDTYALNDNVELPPGYERAIKYNLALEIAPNYGKQVTPLIAQTAGGSFKMLKNANLTRQALLLTGLDPTGRASMQVTAEELFT